MRDAYLVFGTISAKASASDAAFAPDVVRTTAEGKNGHVGNVPDITVAFSPVRDFASADSMTPVLYHCDTADGAYTECARGMAVLAPKAGQVVTLGIPRSHKAYLKAGFIPSSTGTFAKSDVEAWIGEGEKDLAEGDYYAHHA